MNSFFSTMHNLVQTQAFYSVLAVLLKKEQSGEIVLYAGTYSFETAMERFGSYDRASFYIYTTQDKNGYHIYLNRMGCGISQDDKIFRFSHRYLYNKGHLSNCFFGEKDCRCGEYFEKKVKKSRLCDNCKKIKTVKSFPSTDKYFSVLEQIKEMLASGEYEMVFSTCPIDAVEDEDGYWYDDSITHTIKCKKCGTIFICSCDTYHGFGSFGKGK